MPERMTPYRKGLAAGAAYHAAFWAWSYACKAARDWSAPRPERPACPYTDPRPARQWNAGLRVKAEAPRPPNALEA